MVCRQGLAVGDGLHHAHSHSMLVPLLLLVPMFKSHQKVECLLLKFVI